MCALLSLTKARRSYEIQINSIFQWIFLNRSSKISPRNFRRNIRKTFEIEIRHRMILLLISLRLTTHENSVHRLLVRFSEPRCTLRVRWCKSSLKCGGRTKVCHGPTGWTQVMGGILIIAKDTTRHAVCWWTVLATFYSFFIMMT